MRYISTRGSAPVLTFEEAMLTGLARDGGLYVPETLPEYSLDEIRQWRGLPYHELAFHIIKPFVDGAIAAARKAASRRSAWPSTSVIRASTASGWSGLTRKQSLMPSRKSAASGAPPWSWK